MKKAIIAVILLIVLCAVLISCNGVKIGINFYVDGEFYEGVRTKGEEEIKMPDDPVKEGYVFQGWYWDEGTWTQPFTAASFLNQSISEAFKVYAYFISEEELASTKLISFETMGAGAVNPVRIKVGELISEPQGLSRPGYYLVGWYREADFTTKWNFATDRVSSDMTLYAKWVSSSDMAGAEIIAGDMTVSGRNASIRIPNASETFSFSEHIAVSPYAVYGIYNDQACTDEIPSGIVNVNVGDNVFYIMVTSGNGSNKSVYTADVYRRHMYSVTYRYNNGTADKVVPAEEDGLIAAEDPGTKTGYTFTGWGDWNFGSDTVSDNVLLEAEWTANEYDVTFDSALGSAVEAVKVTYDEEYAWSVPERRGYTFLGWSDGEKMLTDAEGNSLSVWNTAENAAVVAVWEAVEYSVSYENLKGAANSNVVKYTIEDEITFAALAQDGYTFIEWVDENGSAIEGISKGSIGNRVISAVWELIGYTATFVADGVKVADIPFNVETVSVTEPEIPAKTGYTAGWEDYSFIAQNITVNAVYTPVIYKVIYNVAGAYDVDTPVNANPTSYTIEDETITLVPASKTGYTFVKWTKDGEDITEIAQGSHGDITVTAVWEVIEYNIEYIDAPVNSNVTSYTVETETFALATPEKTGYDFVNWTENGIAVTEIPQGSYGDKTITANWNVHTYTITYTGVAGAYDVDTPVNTNPTSYTIEDETITLAPASKTGYTFVKWTKDGEDITEIAQGSYGDITVTAVWQTVTYTLDMIMENDEGGYDGHYEGEENRTSFTVEDEFTFVEPICDIRGYEFKGWYTLKNDGDKVEGIASGTVGNKTYYARWQRSEYTIVYRNTENAVNGNPTSYNVESESITLVDPSKTGYTFAGWYSDSDLSQVADTTIATGSIGDLEFYAKWNAIVYTVDYVLYEGVNGDNPTSYTIEDEITLSAATRDGYSFGGWFTDSAFENAIDKIALGSTGNMTLYAKWYYTGTVSFVTNGGSAIESVTQEYGTVLVAPEDPVREHYTFAGWYSDEALQNEYVFSTMPDIDFTLYAKWEAVEYSITYVLNGGENGLNPDVYTVESAFDFAEATKTGYTFVAWYTLPDFTSAPVSSIAAGTFGDMTLYANYSINSYTISFDSAGGSAVTSITQEYDTAVSAPPAPSRNGYRFSGWLTEEGEAFVFDRIPAYDVALTADWELIEYTITYNLGGGVNDPSNPAFYTIEDETVTFAAPTRRGYTFRGWFADSGYTQQITEIPAGSYGVVDVEAKWEIIVYDITYYNVDGLENPNPGTYTVEDVVSFAEVFKLGHTFGGFFKEEGFVTSVTGIAEGSIGDVAVYAKYTVNTYNVWLDGKDEADYTVSFDLSGASGSVASQHIVGDAALEYPAIPQRSGYLFGGWYQTEDCTGNAYDFTASVRSDITLYAKWIEISNTAITIGDSVSVSVEGTTLHYYDFVPLVSGDISVTTTGTVDTFGYLYDGDGTLLRSNDDGSDGGNFLIKYNVTAGEKYTIAFRGYGKASGGESVLYLSGNNTVAAGGTAAESGIMREITFGTSFTLPVPEAREGYVFRGWADADGTMYTDAEGNSIRVFDKGEETVLVSSWEVDGFDITFATNGGTAVETVTIPRGGRVDINSFVTTRSGYSFLGWYLSASDSEPYNATVMPDYDFTLYAKWTAYALDPIKYDESILVATSLRDLTADDFGATCFDNGGNQVEITVSISTQTAGETATVRLTATSNGKTRTATIQNVRIYGEPTLTFDDGVTYFNLKDGLTADWFTASGTDTFGEATEIQFEIEGDYAAGDTVTVIIKSVDPAGNVTSGSVENVMVYGLPVITYNEEKGEISVNDVLSAELLTATAADSFGEEVAVAVTLTNGTIAAGNTVTLTLTATDKYGNTTVINKDFAVYGMPTISNAETLEFRVEDEITTESLGITARDTYGAALEISLAVKEGAQSAGVTMIWTATVTDIAGNVTTKDYSVRIYGTPVITYDRDAVKVTEDATAVSVLVTFDLNGADGTAPDAQTVTETTGLEYPDIPTRSGYVFAGWYDNAGCGGTPYDFTARIENDITLYAKWVQMSASGYSNTAIDAVVYNSADNYYSESLVGTNSSGVKNIYFAALTGGSIKLYYSNGNSSTSSYYRIYMSVYNVTTGTTIRSNSYFSNSSFSSLSFNANAGDVIRVSVYRYNTSYSPTFRMYLTGTALPSDGGVFAYSGAEKYLNAYAYDSFGNKLTVTASVSGGELAGGSYITYTLTAVDHLGNVGTITTAAIPVYDVEDISLSYDAFSTDIIKLTSTGEEFTASATDSFGEACVITVERAGGGAIVAGEVQDIVIVATDRAGNRYVSETVSGIKVYGMPTAALTYPDNGYTVSENDDISFLFIVRDSFGEEIYAEVTSDAPLVAGNTVNITVTATDDAGYVFEQTYLFAITSETYSWLLLYVGETLWNSLFVTDNVLPLPTVDGMVFYGWFDGNGTRFTDEAGNLLVTPDEYVVLYAGIYPEGYTPISTAEELKNISLDGKYALVCDIDLGGAEWTPIGTSDDPFIGEFDGNGYTVSNFKITTGRTYVGLFGYNNGVIKNLGVENFTVNVRYSGAVYAGGLVGRNSGVITNSYATGNVSATASSSGTKAYAYAGGLVGYNSGDITNSYAAGNVSATSTYSSYAYAGGLVGRNNSGSILNSYATGEVSATATSYSAYAGGLVGYNSGDITNSYATGNVSATSTSASTSIYYYAYAGGLVGYNSGSILNSYATGNVSATSTSSSYAYAGGLVGDNDSGDITNSYAAGDVSATGSSSAYAGGLVGYNSGDITNSYATGEVSATADDPAYAGGLVGYNSGDILNSYATGEVGATSTPTYTYAYAYAYAGGLVGYNSGSILNSYATGDVSATSTSISSDAYAYAGGLVGRNNSGSITNCYRYSGQTFYRKEGSDTYSTASNTEGTAVSLDNLKSPSWVNENLWTIEFEIWDFSNGYPTLDYEYIDSAIITISTAEELERLQGQTLVLSYELNADIDLGGMEWTPVATFYGTFNGNGYTVSNFKITTGRRYVGLFGYNKGVIENLGVENFTVNVSYSGNVYAGGLVGYNSGSITNSYATGEVSATATSTSSSSAYAGGLVGYNSGDILNSYATGNVSATSTGSSSYASAYAGGLVGDNDSGSILNSYATGNVSASASSAYAGGLVGDNDSGSILNSYATGEVSATADDSAYAGGLVGYNSGSITNSYATGEVSATADDSAYAGGLVGYNWGDITNSYAAGNVSATSTGFSAYAGGLVGSNSNSGSITNCYRYSGQTVYCKEGSDTYSTASNTLGTAKDLTTLRSVSFHTSTLGWDESVWNFAEGAFPTLKNAGTAMAGQA